MSNNRRFRHCRPRQAATHREFTLRSGGDLAGRPPMIRMARCCTGKVQYFAQTDAELALAGIDRTDPRRHEQRAYRCPSCDGWHLTSRNRRTPEPVGGGLQ